jgi:hypothetical protein
MFLYQVTSFLNIAAYSFSPGDYFVTESQRHNEHISLLAKVREESQNRLVLPVVSDGVLPTLVIPERLTSCTFGERAILQMSTFEKPFLLNRDAHLKYPISYLLPHCRFTSKIEKNVTHPFRVAWVNAYREGALHISTYSEFLTEYAKRYGKFKKAGWSIGLFQTIFTEEQRALILE